MEEVSNLPYRLKEGEKRILTGEKLPDPVKPSLSPEQWEDFQAWFLRDRKTKLPKVSEGQNGPNR